MTWPLIGELVHARAWRVQVVGRKWGDVVSQSRPLAQDQARRLHQLFLEDPSFDAVSNQIRLAQVEPVPGQFPKTCGCGLTHTAQGWQQLKRIGEHGDEVETLEHRNCSCGSTLSVILDRVVAWG